jgi:predicted RNase H-like nuclease (RuvC/YqgF family)
MQLAIVFKEKKKENREKMTLMKHTIKSLQTENTDLEQKVSDLKSQHSDEIKALENKLENPENGQVKSQLQA